MRILVLVVFLFVSTCASAQTDITNDCSTMKDGVFNPCVEIISCTSSQTHAPAIRYTALVSKLGEENLPSAEELYKAYRVGRFEYPTESKTVSLFPPKTKTRDFSIVFNSEKRAFDFAEDATLERAHFPRTYWVLGALFLVLTIYSGCAETGYWYIRPTSVGIVLGIILGLVATTTFVVQHNLGWSILHVIPTVLTFVLIFSIWWESGHLRSALTLFVFSIATGMSTAKFAGDSGPMSRVMMEWLLLCGAFVVIEFAIYIMWSRMRTRLEVARGGGISISNALQ